MSPRTLSTALIAFTVLYGPAYAQDSPTCEALTPHLSPNASASLTIPALRVAVLGGPPTEDIILNNETDFQWQLSSYVQPRTHQDGESDMEERDTQTIVWLDTDASNTTRLGSSLRMCHNFVPLQTGSNVTWSHSTLERSVEDTGDCRALVSEACLDRLRAQYAGQAATQRSQYSSCTGSNTTVPWECLESGMVEPISRPNPDFNSTLGYRVPFLSNGSSVEAPEGEQLVCDGRNFTSKFGTIATTQDYDLATNFPLMDIMTFFPIAPAGNTFNSRTQRVEIACLVPGQVADGSREKANVEDVLGRYNSTGGNQTADEGGASGGSGGGDDNESAGMSAFGRVMEMWALVVCVLSVTLANAV